MDKFSSMVSDLILLSVLVMSWQGGPGSILAQAFKYLYSKLCECEARPAELPSQARLPAIKEDTVR